MTFGRCYFRVDSIGLNLKMYFQALFPLSRFICSGKWILFSNIIYLYALCYIFAGCHGICP